MLDSWSEYRFCLCMAYKNDDEDNSRQSVASRSAFYGILPHRQGDDWHAGSYDLISYYFV